MNKDEKNQSSWTECQEVTEIYKKNTKSMKRKENNQQETIMMSTKSKRVIPKGYAFDSF